MSFQTHKPIKQSYIRRFSVSYLSNTKKTDVLLQKKQHVYYKKNSTFTTKKTGDLLQKKQKTQVLQLAFFRFELIKVRLIIVNIFFNDFINFVWFFNIGKTIVRGTLLINWTCH